MIDTVMISEVIKIDISQLVETGDNIDKIEVEQGMNKNYRGGNFRGKSRMYQDFKRQNNRGCT